MKFIASIMFIITAFTGFAQTNELGFLGTNATKLIITTNLFESPAYVRIVEGKAYNSEKSPLWKKLTGTIGAKRDGVLIVETYNERFYSLGGPIINSRQSIGASAVSVGSSAREMVKEYGITIAVTNMPDYERLAEGNDINVTLMRTGLYKSKGRTFELWDRGTVYRTNVIRTNSVMLKNSPPTSLPSGGMKP